MDLPLLLRPRIPDTGLVALSLEQSHLRFGAVGIRGLQDSGL